jgi:TonB family protein
MRHTILALAALSTALASSPVRAEPVVLKPSSPWNVDFGEERCRLARFFGDDDNKHVLIFEQYWPGDNLGMTAAGNAFKPFRSTRPTEISFFGPENTTETRPFTGDFAEYGNALVFSNVWVAKITQGTNGAIRIPGDTSQLDTAIAREVSAATFRQGDKMVELTTGPLDEAFKVLNLCANDLVASWGLDPEQVRTASQPVRWTNGQAITKKILDVYPSQAAREGEQAILRMRVIVNERGEMEECKLFESTVTDKLDSPVCRIMKGACFEPALDAQGKPMRSYYATSITYKLN